MPPAGPPARPPERHDMRGHDSTAKPDPLLSFILIVEDSPRIRRFIKFAVAPLAREVIATGSARKALSMAATRAPDRIFVDLRLPDLHGTALIGRLRHLDIRSPIIVVTGYPDDLPDEIKALGIDAVLHKPVIVDQLQNAVRAVRVCDLPRHAPSAMNAAERWVALVDAGLHSMSDPRTRTDLARCGHISLGVFKDICLQLHISARQTCHLVRVLRAVRIANQGGGRPEDALDVGDHRTLGRLLNEAGITDGGESPSITAFLERQRFIPRPNRAMQLLQQRLARRYQH